MISYEHHLRWALESFGDLESLPEQSAVQLPLKCQEVQVRLRLWHQLPYLMTVTSEVDQDKSRCSILEL